MKLNQLIKQLRKLQDDGKGELQVYARHGSSGTCDPLGSSFITNRVDELGPFDLEEGEEYISIYVGH